MDKRKNATEVVANLRDGMTLGIGGWGGRRKPMALVREILRSPLKDLTVVAYAGADVGLLCAAGKVRELVYGFVSHDVVPLEAYFRKARQAGEFETFEIDEGMLYLGLRAAAMRVPFLPTRAGLASGVLEHNTRLKTVRSPYADGEELVAMPALKLDAAFIHVNRADQYGNSEITGPDPFFDEWFARAADYVCLSCEELAERSSFSIASARSGSMPIERSQVNAVVQAPFGAHPTACAPRYGIDVEHIKAYSATAKEEGGFAAYRARHIDCGEDEYLKLAGGAERVESLPLPIF